MDRKYSRDPDIAFRYGERGGRAQLIGISFPSEAQAGVSRRVHKDFELFRMHHR